MLTTYQRVLLQTVLLNDARFSYAMIINFLIRYRYPIECILKCTPLVYSKLLEHIQVIDGSISDVNRMQRNELILRTRTSVYEVGETLCVLWWELNTQLSTAIYALSDGPDKEICKTLVGLCSEYVQLYRRALYIISRRTASEVIKQEQCYMLRHKHREYTFTLLSSVNRIALLPVIGYVNLALQQYLMSDSDSRYSIIKLLMEFHLSDRLQYAAVLVKNNGMMRDRIKGTEDDHTCHCKHSTQELRRKILVINASYKRELAASARRRISLSDNDSKYIEVFNRLPTSRRGDLGKHCCYHAKLSAARKWRFYAKLKKTMLSDEQGRDTVAYTAKLGWYHKLVKEHEPDIYNAATKLVELSEAKHTAAQ
jgi:hypothetical protein